MAQRFHKSSAGMLGFAPPTVVRYSSSTSCECGRRYCSGRLERPHILPLGHRRRTHVHQPRSASTWYSTALPLVCISLKFPVCKMKIERVGLERSTTNMSSCISARTRLRFGLFPPHLPPVHHPRVSAPIATVAFFYLLHRSITKPFFAP